MPKVKGKQYFLFASLLGVLLLLLAACGGSTNGQTSSSSEQTSSQQTSGSSIVGTWTGNCTLQSTGFKQAEFDTDGTLVLDGYVAKYEVSGGQVRFIAPQATLQFNYSISADGNTLTLTDSRGVPCMLARAGSNASQTIAQSLIGVWTGTCTGNYGFSKIEFKPDGTAGIDGDYSWKWSLPDFSHINLVDSNNTTDTWDYSLSGSTLVMTTFDISQNETMCTLQKSA
jgi:hypothetical protein